MSAVGDKNEELTNYLKEQQEWLNSNQDEEPLVYEEKLKEIQEKMQSSMPQGESQMPPQSAEDAGVPPHASEDSGPTIEEID